MLDRATCGHPGWTVFQIPSTRMVSQIPSAPWDRQVAIPAARRGSPERWRVLPAAGSHVLAPGDDSAAAEPLHWRRRALSVAPPSLIYTRRALAAACPRVRTATARAEVRRRAIDMDPQSRCWSLESGEGNWYLAFVATEFRLQSRLLKIPC